jgi:23S rRNA-/tRNA-specific pseudouridylate synthase
LDSATGGLILVAVNGAAAAAAKEAFLRLEVRKTYYAVVQRRRNFSGGRWRDRISTDRSGNRLRANGDCRRGAEALADVAQVDSSNFNGIDLSILKLQPITGRTHQLRYQCALRSMAIVGDKTYGDFSFNRRVAKELAVRGLQLHSAEIEITNWHFADGRSFFARSPRLEFFLDWGRFSSGELDLPRQKCRRLVV